MTNPRTTATDVEQLSRLLKAAGQELDRAVGRYLEELSIAQWHVLAALENGAGRPMSELGNATLLPGPSLTRLIDAMVDGNLVLRKADLADRRRVLVFHTRRGAALYQRIRNRLAKVESLGDVSSSGSETADDLARLIARLREAAPPRSAGDD